MQALLFDAPTPSAQAIQPQRAKPGPGSWVDHQADHVGPTRKADSIVAILSLGEPRPFHLKPVRGGLLRTWRLGWGDLLVLGGRIQVDFLHGVPKVASALPRMSVMFRDGSG